MLQLIKYLNRLRLGHKPLFVEYDYDFSSRWGSLGNKYLSQIIEFNRPLIESNLSSMKDFFPLIEELSCNSAKEPKVNWKNSFIPALDAMSLMWAAKKTKSTFIEIGSGNSTLFVKRALEYQDSKVRLISVDPYPRISINTVCDEIIRSPLENMDLALFDRLMPGDTLFIDNSHRSFTNSDVTVVMMDVLPRINSGVLIGFHDIFLPFDYPQEWSNRFYNEQYLLASYILSNQNYFTLQLCNYWIWRQGAHNAPLANIWNFLGQEVRDRGASAFWAIKN